MKGRRVFYFFIFFKWVSDQNIALDGHQGDATHVREGQLPKI